MRTARAWWSGLGQRVQWCWTSDSNHAGVSSVLKQVACNALLEFVVGFAILKWSNTVRRLSKRAFRHHLQYRFSTLHYWLDLSRLWQGFDLYLVLWLYTAVENTFVIDSGTAGAWKYNEPITSIRGSYSDFWVPWRESCFSQYNQCVVRCTSCVLSSAFIKTFAHCCNNPIHVNRAEGQKIRFTMHLTKGYSLVVSKCKPNLVVRYCTMWSGARNISSSTTSCVS